MGKVSNDPRTYLREALALSDRVLDRPSDEATAVKLAVKVQALAEALAHGGYELVSRRARRSRSGR